MKRSSNNIKSLAAFIVGASLFLGLISSCSFSGPSNGPSSISSSSEPTSSEPSSESSSSEPSSEPTSSEPSSEPTSEPSSSEPSSEPTSSEPSSEPSSSEPSSSEDDKVYYIVNHYLENLSGDGYDKQYSETFTGVVGDKITIKSTNYEGFTPDYEEISVVLQEDEASVIDFYYERNSYTVNFITNGGKHVESIELKYEYTLPKDIKTTREESTFEGWYLDIDQTESFTSMPAEEVTLYAYYSEELKASNFTYKISGDEVTITDTTYLGADLVIPSYIGGYPVTKLGDYCFENGNFISAIIPSSVERILSYAFYNCSSLSNIDIPENITFIGERAFEGCSSLESVNFIGESNIEIIDKGAFYDCSSLFTISVPKSIEYIGEYAFFGCDSIIIFIEVKESSTEWPSYWHGGNEYYFDAGHSQSYVNDTWYGIHDDYVELIVYKGETDNLLIDREIDNFPVTSIKSNAFLDNETLETVFIPNSFSNVHENGLKTNHPIIIFVEDETNTDGFASLWYGENEYYFNAGRSQQCIDGIWYGIHDDNVELIVYKGIDAEVTILDQIDGLNVTLIRTEAFLQNQNIVTVNIPSTVKYINSYAFDACSLLTNVNFLGNSNLATISDFAFYYCSSLLTIDLPASLTKIGKYAFYHCSSLTILNIHKDSKLEYIGSGAFDSLTQLKAITYNASFASLINKQIINGLDNLESVYFTDTIGDWCNLTFESSSENLMYYATDFYILNESNEFELVTEIIIPDNVTRIGNYQFYNFNSVEIVDVSDSVKTIGEYAFYKCSSISSITLPFVGDGTENNTHLGYLFGAYFSSFNDDYVPTSLKEVILLDGCVSIGDYAFSGCSSLTSIEIPDSVTSIGNYAFSECTSLTSFVIPNSITSISQYAFANCSSLSSIVIPGSVTTIDSYAFSGCTSLTSITIPDSVTTIGFSAFSSCSSLTSITLPFVGDGTENNTHLGYIFGATSYSDNEHLVPWSLAKVIISDACTSIGYRAFYGCSSLTSMTLPFIGDGTSNKTHLGYLFGALTYSENYDYVPTSLKEVILSDSCVSIGSYAFRNCTSLTSTVIPDSVTSIGSYAFSACSSLTSIIIPDSVTSLGRSAFRYCSSLSSIDIPKKITSIDEYTFSDCSSLASITIPDSVTSIDSFAFYNCRSLTSVTLGNGVTTIGSSVFSDCTSLTSIIIPDNVTSIGSYAFAGCSSITSIVIPDSVTSIGIGAFYGSSLETITLPFVGDGTSKNTHLGYIFGATSLSEVSIRVPMSLAKVIISGACTSLGSNAFYNCNYIRKITFGDNVVSIGQNAFYNCSFLTDINYNGTIEDWCNITFENANSNPMSYAKNFYLLQEDNTYELVKELIIPNTVTTIGNYQFYNFSITSVVIPDSVTTIGNYVFYKCSSLISINVNENNLNYSSIDNVLYNKDATTLIYCPIIKTGEFVIPDSVTTIFDYGFAYCSSLTSIVIPDSVTSIGYSAFYKCTSLITLTLPFVGDGTSENTHLGYVFGTSSYKYNNNYVPVSLKNIFISDACTTIGSYAFYGCSSITSVNLGNGVTLIGDSAFSGCSSLTSIVILDSVTTIGSYAFYNCTSLTSITIPDSVTSIGIGAFSHCSSLTSIVIPDSVTSIGNSTFSHCSSLASIVIPDSVTKIGEYAFYNCSSLTSITIPDSVTSIGNSAFSNCSSLTSIVIPDSVTKIGEYAFRGCSSLVIYCEATSRPSGWDYDWNYSSRPVFWGISKEGVFYDETTSLIYVIVNNEITISGYIGEPISIDIPSEINGYPVTTIGTYLFYNCSSLVSITIPNSVTSIGSYAFSGCSSLTSIVIPDSVLTIGYRAFCDCTSLVSVTLGDSVTTIGRYAFANCTSLRSIIIPNSVTSINDYAFDNCSSLTIYCEATSEPYGWYSLWNSSSRPVYWGY